MPDTRDIPVILTIFKLYEQQEYMYKNSRNKRCYGLGCIVTRLEETQLTSIALSVFMSNLFRIQKRILLAFILAYHKYIVLISPRKIVLA